MCFFDKILKKRSQDSEVLIQSFLYNQCSKNISSSRSSRCIGYNVQLVLSIKHNAFSVLYQKLFFSFISKQKTRLKSSTLTRNIIGRGFPPFFKTFVYDCNNLRDIDTEFKT